MRLNNESSASGLASMSGGGMAAAYMPPSPVTLPAFKLVSKSTMSWSYCMQSTITVYGPW